MQAFSSLQLLSVQRTSTTMHPHRVEQLQSGMCNLSWLCLATFVGLAATHMVQVTVSEQEMVALFSAVAIGLMSLLCLWVCDGRLGHHSMFCLGLTCWVW